jgi:hypothetical protein
VAKDDSIGAGRLRSTTVVPYLSASAIAIRTVRSVLCLQSRRSERSGRDAAMLCRESARFWPQRRRCLMRGTPSSSRHRQRSSNAVFRLGSIKHPCAAEQSKPRRPSRAIAKLRVQV